MNQQAVQSKTEMFERLTTTGETDKKNQTKNEDSSRKITVRSYDMEGDVENAWRAYSELARKNVSSLQRVATQCSDDHQLSPEDCETKGELSDICAQIVMKCLYLARIGRPHLARSVTRCARA